MFESFTSTVFTVSLVFMVLILVIRYIEVSFSIKFISKIFRVCDPSVQRFVSYFSNKILYFSNKIKQFLLVHLYRMSSDKAKIILRETLGRHGSLLDKLRGNGPRSPEEKTGDNVSPYLREISRIDRKEE